ncbi:MAG: DUF167 domain-containing protein [Candidatus Paceibacterota bacterium]
MYIKVRVTPGSKKELVREIKSDTFTVATKAPAENNAANKRVRELVADHFSVECSAVRIIAGHRSPSKMLEIRAHSV